MELSAYNGNQIGFGPFAESGSNPKIPSVSEWLETPHLSRIVSFVALRHGIPPQDIPDILQEVRISLIRKGMDSRVNATWVFKAIACRIADYHRGRWDAPGDDSMLDQPASLSCGPDPELTLLLESEASLLPERLRTYYLLRYRLGLKQSEAARQLGISRAAVRHLDEQCLHVLTLGTNVTSAGDGQRRSSPG